MKSLLTLICILGISRNVPVEWGPVSNLQFYNDFAFMEKKLLDLLILI
jgi:hypothetical protein